MALPSRFEMKVNPSGTRCRPSAGFTNCKSALGELTRKRPTKQADAEVGKMAIQYENRPERNRRTFDAAGPCRLACPSRMKVAVDFLFPWSTPALSVRRMPGLAAKEACPPFEFHVAAFWSRSETRRAKRTWADKNPTPQFRADFARIQQQGLAFSTSMWNCHRARYKRCALGGVRDAAQREFLGTAAHCPWRLRRPPSSPAPRTLENFPFFHEGKELVNHNNPPSPLFFVSFAAKGVAAIRSFRPTWTEGTEAKNHHARWPGMNFRNVEGYRDCVSALRGYCEDTRRENSIKVTMPFQFTFVVSFERGGKR